MSIENQLDRLRNDEVVKQMSLALSQKTEELSRRHPEGGFLPGEIREYDVSAALISGWRGRIVSDKLINDIRDSKLIAQTERFEDSLLGTFLTLSFKTGGYIEEKYTEWEHSYTLRLVQGMSFPSLLGSVRPVSSEHSEVDLQTLGNNQIERMMPVDTENLAAFGRFANNAGAPRIPPHK